MHFRPVVFTFAKKYRVLSRGIHFPGYHGTKPCFPLTPPRVKFSIHIWLLRKNTSPFFPKMPEKPGKSTFLNEKSHCFNMILYNKSLYNATGDIRNYSIILFQSPFNFIMFWFSNFFAIKSWRSIANCILYLNNLLVSKSLPPFINADFYLPMTATTLFPGSHQQTKLLSSFFKKNTRVTAHYTVHIGIAPSLQTDRKPGSIIIKDMPHSLMQLLHFSPDIHRSLP